MKSDFQKPTRILKIGTCPSLSKNSTLIFHVGAGPDRSVWIRVAANDGGGYFSSEWVLFQAMLDEMDRTPRAIKSYCLQPLLTGRSVNTTAFLLAVLLQEGVVRLCDEVRRCFECVSPQAFATACERLMDEGVNLVVDEAAVGNKPILAAKKSTKAAGSVPANSAHKV